MESGVVCQFWMERECHAVLWQDPDHLISESRHHLGIIAQLYESWCSNEDAGELPIEPNSLYLGLE